jgi:hypothetical protein
VNQIAESAHADTMIWTLLFAVSVLTAVPFAVLGARVGRPALLITAAVLIAPLALYLAATPRFRLLGPGLAILPLAGALVVKSRRRFAWVFVAPFVLSIATLLVLLANS